MSPPDPAAPRRKNHPESPGPSVRALERGLDVLFCFAGEDAELGVTDVSQRLGLNKAAVSRLMATLAGKGLLAENPTTRKYCLTFKLHGLVMSQLERLDVRSIARPHMQGLRDLTGETVGIYVAFGAERTCIEEVRSQERVRRADLIGRSGAITSGATGRVLLAWRSQAEIAEALAAAPPRSQDTFPLDLEAVRQAGYSLRSDETAPGLGGIAAPIRDHTGQVVAALSVSGPSSRWTRERMMSFLSAVTATACRISEELGYQPDDAAAAPE